MYGIMTCIIYLISLGGVLVGHRTPSALEGSERLKRNTDNNRDKRGYRNKRVFLFLAQSRKDIRGKVG